VSDAEFIRAFERGEITNAAFRHTSHLRLALAYLEASPSVETATERMASALQQFAAAAGKADKYHHTMTVFWMRLIARLLDRELPLLYYSRERLFSDEARRSWVEPDLRALDWAETSSRRRA
jgi:hypothetical protein